MILARPIQLVANGLTAGFGSFTHGLQNSPDAPELAVLRLGSARPAPPPESNPVQLTTSPTCGRNDLLGLRHRLSDRIAPNGGTVRQAHRYPEWHDDSPKPPSTTMSIRRLQGAPRRQ